MQGTSSLERAGCLNENWSPKEKIQELHAFSVGRFASQANVIKVIFCINILFLKFYYLKHLSYVLLTGTFAKKKSYTHEQDNFRWQNMTTIEVMR